MEGDLNEEERFADMEGDLNEEERFADMEGDLNEEERFADVKTQAYKMSGAKISNNHYECDDSDDENESDYMEHSKIPKPTSKVVATTAVAKVVAKKEKFSDMLEEAPFGGCGSSDFASF